MVILNSRTETPAPTTLDAPTTTRKLRVKFETFGDPVLIKMLDAAQDYAAHPRGWLSFVGNSGTGKTYLADAIVSHLRGDDKHWPKFMAKMRSGQFNIYESVEDLAEKDGVLLLDEIGVGMDARDFGMDLLMQVFERRRGRPTLVTSNLTLAGMAELDARMSSRLLRYGKVIACDTMDYALRGLSD